MRKGLIVLLLVGAAFVVVRAMTRPAPPPLPPRAELEAAALQIDRETYSLVRGEAYKRSGDTWSHFTHVFDPDFFARNYVVENGVTYRLADDGQRYAVSRSFRSGFEDAETLPDLIGLRHGWTGFTLQSPSTPTIADYVALRQKILKGSGTFLDNRVEPSRAMAHSGSRALKCVSRAPSFRMVCAKASIETELVHFVRGEHVWFSGWFYIADGEPLTLMDLETVWAVEHPGLRVQFDDAGAAFVELKWTGKPTFRQNPSARVAFPRKRWVHLVTHFVLSEKSDGLVELWQDGTRLIEARGQTLPFAEAIYNSLEIGISATQKDATVFVDDIELSGSPLNP